MRGILSNAIQSFIKRETKKFSHCTWVTHIDFTEDAGAVVPAMLAHYSVFVLLISHEGTERGTLGFRGSNTDHEPHCPAGDLLPIRV